MTVASEQCVIVGVTSTVRVVRLVVGDVVRWMSGRLTTDKEPRVRGCSGSAMGAMRSTMVVRWMCRRQNKLQMDRWRSNYDMQFRAHVSSKKMRRQYHKSLAHQWDRPSHLRNPNCLDRM